MEIERAKPRPRHCSQCGAATHDLRNCSKKKRAARAAPKPPSSGGDLPPDIRAELEKLGALRRALDAAGFRL